MSNPFVTVFIPVYNSEQYISETIDSILNQTYKNLEVLIVDDGSTDRSIEIIQQYQDQRIRLIQNEKNMGIPYTRNVGLQEARGDYIAIMDADDIACSNRIERQVTYLENNKGIDAVGSFYYKFGEGAEKEITTPFTAPEQLKMMLLFYNPIANPSVTIRKKTFQEHNLTYHLDFFVAQDYQMWSQLIKVGNITILPEFLLYYRFGHENISKKSNLEKAEKRKQLIDRIHNDLIDFYQIPLTVEEKQTFNNFFTESYGSRVESLEQLKTVIEKIKNWNLEQRVFNHNDFLKVLDYCILLGINHQGLTAHEKLAIYNSTMSERTGKDRINILTRHYYYKLKKII